MYHSQVGVNLFAKLYRALFLLPRGGRELFDDVFEMRERETKVSQRLKHTSTSGLNSIGQVSYIYRTFNICIYIYIYQDNSTDTDSLADESSPWKIAAKVDMSFSCAHPGASAPDVYWDENLFHAGEIQLYEKCR